MERGIEGKKNKSREVGRREDEELEEANSVRRGRSQDTRRKKKE
jgi:hypothetical protein